MYESIKKRKHNHEGHEEREVKFDRLSNKVIECAINVHRTLGAGLLESTYEQCLAYELNQKGIAFTLQHPLPVKYKGIKLDCGYRVDVYIENKLIVELKSCEKVLPIHEALASYVYEVSKNKNWIIDEF